MGYDKSRKFAQPKESGADIVSAHPSAAAGEDCGTHIQVSQPETKKKMISEKACAPAKAERNTGSGVEPPLPIRSHLGGI